ncbi:PEGA domain-containing protein [Paraliomyxa miuraensis]|uniref:PEGA domain-containing protein n=1 Tax=Paraliomyxa miuraensis TaxID=376150 RepID=UPI0022500AE1|nr:PEGA domain-containing protein [Paraliomyxa miuraensis]MCX4242548.1 PEGA domain-containing protein [Paraliomyxa miuraensis]
MAWLVPLSTALTLALAPRASGSDPAPSAEQVGTMHLRLPNDVSGPDQSTLQQRFEDGVARSGLTTRGVPASASSCEDPACYRDTAKAADVDLLVGGTIEHTGPDFAIEVYAISAETGEVVASVEGVCEICGVGELAESVGALAARLRPSLENATQPTTLTVDSDPEGADVYVDGERVGSTPVQARVAPGQHEIDVVKRGRRTQHVEVDLRPGVNESYSFRLARSSRVPVWVPWAALATGVGSLGAGIGLLVIDERPIQSDCNADVNGTCQYLYDTVNGGVVLTVVGVALVSTGVGLMLAQRRQDRLQRSGVGARLRLVPGIGGASLTGRF